MYIPQEPVTLKDPFGTRVDDFAWMHERDSADVLSFIRSQNDHVDRVMHTMRGDISQLHAEMMRRLDRDDISVPVYEDSYYYYTRTEKGKNYPIHCRRRTMDSPEEILIDENERAATHDYYSLGCCVVSPDSRIMAYAEDTVGRRNYTIRFRDLEDGRDLPLEITDTHAGVVWSSDSRSVFFLKFDPKTLRTCLVHWQSLVGSVSRCIFEEKHVEFSLTLRRSRDKTRLFIVSTSTNATVVYETPLKVAIMDLKPQHLIGAHDQDIRYQVDCLNDSYYMIEDIGRETRFFCQIDKIRTELFCLTDTVMHSLQLFTDRCAWVEHAEGQARLYYAFWNELHSKGVDARKEIKAPHDVYDIYPTGNSMALSHKIRFAYETPIHPAKVFELNTRTGMLKNLKTTRVPRYDEREYMIHNVRVRSQDGKTEIPMTVFHHRTIPLNGSAPALIYGYGAYGICVNVDFNPTWVSLLNRGFVIAYAHVRGGADCGQQWYDAGRILKKWNTFHDFADCSKYLIEQKYCASNKLTAMGGSAGGLLMGVMLNEHPDLYQAIVAQVPFVDVLTTMLNDSIPLTTLEYSQWGDPRTKDVYDYILTYSPYDNVRSQAIPHLLVISGYHDSQVQYWEPAKWVAKLRKMRTNRNQLVLKMSMVGGHQSQSGLSNRIKEVAETYAFLLNAVNSASLR